MTDATPQRCRVCALDLPSACTASVCEHCEDLPSEGRPPSAIPMPRATRRVSLDSVYSRPASTGHGSGQP